MKKEIVLVMPYKLIELKIPPFSLLYLSASLKRAGFKTRIVHCPDTKIKECIDDILRADPLFVGFSVLTGLPIKYAVIMSREIKKRGADIPIVWGGVHPSILPDQCLNEDYIDYVVVGEGEKTIVELANSLSKQKDLKKIVGLGFKENNKPYLNPARPLEKNINKFRLDLEFDFAPYITHRLENKEGKKIEIRSLGYYSSRGCPHNCSFCYNNSFHKQRWRACSTQLVIDDIQYFKQRYGVNEIQFWDDNFWVDRERAIKILKGIGVFSTSEIRIDYVDEDLLKKAKEFGVQHFILGAESGSNRLLKLINKGFTREDVLIKADLFNKYSFKVLYSFMIGIPTEKKDEIYQTIDFLLTIKKIHSKASFTVGVYLPYPGTRLFNLATKLGYCPPLKTEEWYKVDRWSDKSRLPWLNPKIGLNVRHLFAMLNWGFPISLWSELRLRMRWLSFKEDLRLIIFIHMLKKWTSKKEY